MLLLAGVMDEMERSSISPETCKADWVQINKPNVASGWSSIMNYNRNLKFLATDTEVSGSIPGSTRFSE